MHEVGGEIGLSGLQSFDLEEKGLRSHCHFIGLWEWWHYRPAPPCDPASLPDLTFLPLCIILCTMSYRSLYLVCYDVCDPRRLRHVHKFLLGYKVGGQKSFFECWLTPPELNVVRRTLAELIDPNEDRVHVFQLNPRMAPDLFGLAESVPLEAPFMVV